MNAIRLPPMMDGLSVELACDRALSAAKECRVKKEGPSRANLAARCQADDGLARDLLVFGICEAIRAA